MTGKITPKDDGYMFSKFDTGIQTSAFCCCTAEEDNYTIHRLYREKKSREQIYKTVEQENNVCTFGMRLVGLALHFLSYYLILYPMVLLLGIIPYFGAVGASLLIVFALMFSLMTFLIIISISWLAARPVISLIIMSFVIMLYYTLGLIKQQIDFNNNNTPPEKFL
jgi:hypothetical protein